MSVPSSLLRVPIEVPNRSGHNMSHSNSFTGTTGTLIPVLCEELLPNDKVTLGSQLQVQLPPMVTDFYGKVDFVLEAFFVPNRLCWGGWQDFITHPTANPVYPVDTPVQAKPNRVPYLFVSGNSSWVVPKDSLASYLDYGAEIFSLQSENVSVLPMIAYHRIWDDWYRDSRVQSPLFYRSGRIVDSFNQKLSSLPYSSTDIPVDGSNVPLYLSPDSQFPDGVSLTSLRQRNWVKDYFTTASPLPQAGNASSVSFDIQVDPDDGSGTSGFSISTLRAANSLQKWMERNNLAGYRYSDQIYAQFGIYPSDAIMDRPLYLGRSVQTVYNKSVYSTVAASEDTGGVLGTKGANSQVLGEGSLVDSFTASEHGYLMVLASMVPRPVYGSGAERRNYRTRVGDFAFPLLAGMGDQEIKAYELHGYSNDSTVFGYTDLYAEYKFRNDKIHGLLRDFEQLDSYALQRTFDRFDVTQISSSFLQIPKNYMDQVQAVSTSASGYNYWASIYFPFKKISTIPAYSQPTLADLKNAHTEYISRGGKRL